jgi:hypothetical protein
MDEENDSASGVEMAGSTVGPATFARLMSVRSAPSLHPAPIDNHLTAG